MLRPALLTSLRRGYRLDDLRADAGAGVLVGVVALPLSIGLAIASGASPAQGLVAAVVGGLLISLLGGSRTQIGGPAGAFVGLCAAGILQYGYDGLLLATMMAGVLMTAFGLLRLGRAISFIPTPVVIGFTTGIAILIAVTQLAPALGLAEAHPPPAHPLERVGHLWDHRHDISVVAVLVTATTITLLALARRYRPRWPGALLAVGAVSGGCWVAGVPVTTLHDRFGDLPTTLPTFGLPALPDTFPALLDRLRELSPLALAIALLGSIESLLSAVVADGLSGDRHDSNQELVAQGVANLVTPLVGGLPVTGVIARTGTNIRAGARTPVAGILHTLTVLAAILVAAPLVGAVPLACLAGLLLSVCWHMAELRHWPHVLRTGRGDALLLPLACGLTVVLDLSWAVILGVLVALLVFVRRMADTVTIQRDPTESLPSGPLPPGVLVYAVNGPFFFGAATLLRDLEDELEVGHRALVLRLGHVPFIDATAGFGLRELAVSCRARGAALVLCEANARVQDELRRLHLDAHLAPDLAHAVALEALAPVLDPAHAVR